MRQKPSEQSLLRERLFFIRCLLLFQFRQRGFQILLRNLARQNGPGYFTEGVNIVQFGHHIAETGVKRKDANRLIEINGASVLRHERCRFYRLSMVEIRNKNIRLSVRP